MLFQGSAKYRTLQYRRVRPSLQVAGPVRGKDVGLKNTCGGRRYATRERWSNEELEQAFERMTSMLVRGLQQGFLYVLV